VNRLTNLAEFGSASWAEPVEEADSLSFTMHREFNSIRELWVPFQRIASTTLFGTLHWAELWQTHIGDKLGAKPRIIVARDRYGAVQFIMPLQIRRRMGLDILEWHGYPDVNYGYGLYAKSFLPRASEWFKDHLQRVLTAAGPYDAVSLHDMPETMAGWPHPLRAHFNLHAANATFLLQLDADYEALYRRRRAAETRRANGRKDHRLAESGRLDFFKPKSPDDIQRYVSVMIEQKTKQLAARGVHEVFGPGETALILGLAASTQDEQPLTETHVVTLDGEPLAVTFGGRVDGTYWFYVSSLADNAAARKHSPGDYALRRTIEACCASGLKSFDFGVGDAEYKRGWADRTAPLHVILRANNLRGLPWVMLQAGRLWATRQVKQNAGLRAAAFALRRRLRGSRS
jgi:CelD/BcsL family acetyltransferase involved in cellulose biosynthesis